MKPLSWLFSIFLLFVCARFEAQAETWNTPSAFEGESLLTGKNVKISKADSNHKGLVMVFMSTKCPCSHSHADLIKKLAQQHKDFRFLIVHSNADESKSEALTYFKIFSNPIEVLHDEKAQIADLLRAYKTPHTFVFDAKGEVIYRGGVTDSSNASSAERHYLAEVLQDISSGKTPRLNQSRTLGCVISREGEKNVF